MRRNQMANTPFKVGQLVESDLYPGVQMRITGIKFSRYNRYFFTVYLCDWKGKPPNAMDAFYAKDLRAIKGAECDVST